MIADMRLAAREDRDKNAQKVPATKKISMLPSKLHVSEFQKKTRLLTWQTFLPCPSMGPKSFWRVQIILVEYQPFWMCPICFGRV